MKNSICVLSILFFLPVLSAAQQPSVKAIKAALWQAMEPSSNAERDPHYLTLAEERLQMDRNQHRGNAVHDLDYYYAQVVNEKFAETTQPKKTPKTTQPKGKPIKKCVWCDREQTPENEYFRCPADQDVFCYFVSEEPYEQPQKTGIKPAVKQKPHTKLVKWPVVTERCARCGRPRLDNQEDTHCPADPDIFCEFEKVTNATESKPITPEEMEALSALFHILQDMSAISENTTIEIFALAMRAGKDNPDIKSDDPSLELTAELAHKYLIEEKAPRAGYSFTVSEIFAALAFMDQVALFR